MPIDPVLLWRQIDLGEDSDLELKGARFRGRRVAGPRRDALADALAAFANAEGGRLVLGVADDRRPQSLDARQLDALADFVKEICSDKIQPALDFRLHRVPVPEADKQGVLVVEVPPGVTVHRSPGGYFRRRGTAGDRWARRKSAVSPKPGANRTPPPRTRRSWMQQAHAAWNPVYGADTRVREPTTPKTSCFASSSS